MISIGYQYFLPLHNSSRYKLFNVRCGKCILRGGKNAILQSNLAMP